MVIRRFRMAMDQLVELDGYLFLHDVSERSITHKLGAYLAPLFPEFDVDCEYNRNFDEPKVIWRYLQEHPGIREEVKVNPDIIIHHRGSNDSNLLIIEAKKVDRPQDEHEFDKLKIELYAKNPLNYFAGIRLVFDTGRRFQDRFVCKIYHGGTWYRLPYP